MAATRSRVSSFVLGLASGYAVLVITIVHTLVAVPLALHYLSNEEFGLWAMMVQLAGYLALIDSGMSNSVARLLIDHKDRRDDGVYGGLLTTGWLVLGLLGCVVWLTGSVGAGFFHRALDISPGWHDTFVALLRWQCGITAFGFATKIFSQMLYAQQRVDVYNYAQISYYLSNFIVLWVSFKMGAGIFSLVWANLCGTLLSQLIIFAAVVRLKLFPRAGCWGSPNWKRFRELWDYGRDLFLVVVGTQLIVASQILVITRTLGLEAAAIWAIGTKLYNLASQIIWRVSDVAAPALSEMLARGEQERLRHRYRDVAILSLSLAAVGGVVFWLCNRLFVALWTGGEITWAERDDVLLGLWMFISSVVHCHNGFVLMTKRVVLMRYIYFMEGTVVVVAALVTAPWGGFSAVILCSLIGSVAFSGAYGVWRVADYFQVPVRDVAVVWVWPSLKAALSMLPLALGIHWMFQEWPQEWRLALHGGIGLLAGGVIFLVIGTPRKLRQEVMHRLPSRLQPLFSRFLLKGKTAE